MLVRVLASSWFETFVELKHCLMPLAPFILTVILFVHLKGVVGILYWRILVVDLKQMGIRVRHRVDHRL